MALLYGVVVCGCNLTQAAPTAVPTATTIQVAAVNSPTPTLEDATPTETPTDSPEVTPEPESTPESTSCNIPEDASTTRHTVSATIDYGEKSISARQITRHVNRGDAPLSDLVFNVEPNYWLESFSLISVAGAADTTLTGRRLTVRLSEPLAPGCAVDVELAFALKVPRVGTGVTGFKGFYGYTDRQINLGHWLPTLALRVNNTWITRESFFAGEQTVLDMADWDVTWTLQNAENVTVAAPGELEDLGEGKGRGVLKAARDYSLSLSDRFVMLRDISITGVPVELYTLGSTEVTLPNGQRVDGAPHALTMALRSLELFTDRFGPYPYTRMVVVEGDFPDGMEFSGFAFVSATWFASYDGTPNGYLTLITVHEIAHQWWYVRVGSDSAMTPWLDEALSTYAELLFMEQFYPNAASWWWEFRVNVYSPSGFVDSTVYEFTTLREYINAVYLNGVRMLHQLRIDLGDGAFFALLAAYVESFDGQVVGSSAFWGLLTPEQLAATRATRIQFLRRWDF